MLKKVLIVCLFVSLALPGFSQIRSHPWDPFERDPTLETARDLARYFHETRNPKGGLAYLLSYSTNANSLLDYKAYGAFGLGELHRLEKNWDAAAEAFERAAMTLADYKYPEAVAESWTQCAKARYNQGRFADSVRPFEKALFYRQKMGDKKGEARALNNLGVVHGALGHTDEALFYYRRSFPVMESVGDKKGAAHTIGNIGIIYHDLGQEQKALEYYKKSLWMKNDLRDFPGVAQTLLNIGVVHFTLGDYQKALDSYQKALPRLRTHKLQKEEATLLTNLGALYYDLGDYERALDHHRQSLALRNDIGDEAGIADTLVNLGVVHYTLGNDDLARSIFEDAIVRCKKLKHSKTLATANNDLGLVLRRQGKLPEAIHCFDRAMNLRRTLQDRKGVADSYHNLGNSYRLTGDSSKALDAYQWSYDLHREAKNMRGQVLVLLNLARMARDTGDMAKAREHLKNAEALVKGTPSSDLIYQNHRVAGDIAESAGLPKEAARHYHAAIEEIESMRSLLFGSGRRATFLEGRLKVYEAFISLLLRQSGAPTSGNALKTAERMKARGFLESLSISPDLHNANIRDLLKKRQRVQARMHWLRGR